ncbi:hypothetical protein [Dictyobacter arantiisoli]|uniref:Uncharacterized protein n=1 Tax=Dictyobacter arantiisoli TaxID=2014874 RepID=A0A5A5TBC5_9CHLR|nr:hypothetical protein [Dictyobacter arantiisoli]GCF08456.1 hypothetical protein KDI_20200 [Dictyobacter arantiisoli]
MSEVEQLRRQIALECEAMQRLMHDFAAVAKHEVITHHYAVIADCQSQLETLVGNDEASIITVETYKHAMETMEAPYVSL